jgi:hypothetical protein
MTLASSGSTPSEEFSNLGIYNGGSAITFGGQAVALDGMWNGMPSGLTVSNNKRHRHCRGSDRGPHSDSLDRCTKLASFS